MSRERNKIIAALLGTAVAVVVLAVAMFIGLSKNGSTEKITSEQIAVGEDHMLAVDAGGAVYAWGHNNKGELGNSNCDNQSKPVKAVKISGKVTQVAAGDELSFALCKDGDLYAWGDDTSYQMGDGDNTSRMEPKKVNTDIAMIAAGTKHALAIDTSGALYVWGRNKNGALGVADSACDKKDEEGYACMSAPYKLMDNVAYIDAGDDYSMAITTDGTLYAWGYDEDGQLGLAKTDSTNSKGEAYQSKPAKVMDGIKMVSCGAKYMAFALKENGDLYGWGNNSVGSLGIKTVDDTARSVQTTPKKLMSDVSYVDAGSAHAAVLKTNGDLYTFGVNNYHQIGIKFGDGTYAIGQETIYYQSKPRKLAENVEAVAAGGFNTLYRSKDGVLRSVGCNLYKQLGIGSEESDVKTPTAVYLKN